MKNTIPILIIFISLAIIFSGCVANTLEKSPVLHVNMPLKGNYTHPTFDFENVSRTLEYVPKIKASNYDVILSPPHIFSRIYFNQSIICYDTSLPYTGPGNYSFTYVFLDNEHIPEPNMTLNILFDFADTSGSRIDKMSVLLLMPED